MRSTCAAATAVLALAVNTLAPAQERQSDPRRLAVLDPADAGPDFADQGEYAGQVFVREGQTWRSRPFGLQLAAQGDGQFIALLYGGGLPGAGWDRSERLPLGGTRTEAGIELEGDGTYASIAGRTAKLASARRQFVGELHKVHRSSPTLGLRPPAGARVVFDGTSAGELRSGRMTADGLLREGAEFETPRDFTLHVEFLLPFMPQARGQGRANSGVYLQSRYEVQVLDSFALEGVENECGALYQQRRPAANMCLPPLVWQTYDIDFTSPRFDASGRKVQNARVTVRHNGTLIHDNVEVPAKTGGGAVEGPRLLPTKLQDHGNPVRFRNVWLVDRERVAYVSTGRMPPRVVSRPGVTWRSWPSAGVGRTHVPAGTAGASGVVAGPSGSLGVPQRGWPSPIGYHRELYAPHYGAFAPQYGIPTYGVGGP